MKTYSVGVRRRPLPKRVFILLAAILLIIGIGTFGVQRWYTDNLQPVSTNTIKQNITISTGSTLNQIATQLLKAGLIRNDQVFTWYISVNNARDKLQAGTYSFTPSESTAEIADTIIKGGVATNLVTILPGQRLAEVRQAFIKSGFTSAAVDAALEPTQYRASYPALADNPANSTLEGFLYPDTFQKTADTNPKEIIAESLTEMHNHLTPDIRSGFTTHGLSTYQGVTLASIVEREVPSQTDRNQAAQVFLKRLKMGMPLASDAADFYGAIKDGVPQSVTYDSPYNTSLHPGLPPSPISTVTKSSLDAVSHPATTDWLYFVSGDDGTTHFAKTLDEHNSNIANYCHKLCQAGI